MGVCCLPVRGGPAHAAADGRWGRGPESDPDQTPLGHGQLSLPSETQAKSGLLFCVIV